MTYAQFQEHFEQAAIEELARFDALSLPALLTEIDEGHLGEYYSIWRSLGARAKPLEVNEKLFSFLESDATYLHRYHCAAALIQVNHLSQWQPYELSASAKYPVAANLEKVRALLVSG